MMNKPERNTYQKILMKQILQGNTSHPSAYEVYQEAKKYIPNISFSTVYNNLERMSRKREVIELNDGEKKRFDPNVYDHDHFICIRCKKIMDLPKVSEIKDIPISNVRIISNTTYIKGVCEECLKKEVSYGREDN